MQTELFLKAILDNSTESIVVIAPDHKVILFNKAIQESLFNYMGKMLKVGDDYREFDMNNFQALYRTSFERAAKGERVEHRVETRIDDVTIWIEYRMYPVYHPSGELTAVILTARNIGKEKKADLEREKLATTIDAILENTVDSIVMLDTDFKVLKINKTASKNLKKRNNKSPEVGDDFREHIYQESKDYFFEFFNKALNGESSSYEIMTKDYLGNDFWFQTRVNPVYSNDEKLIGVSIFAHHITEKKLSELALKESEAKFRSIFNSSPIPILIADDCLNVSEINKSFIDLFGFNSSEIAGKHLKVLLTDRFQFPFFYDDEYCPDNPVGFKATIINHIPAITKSGKEIIVNISYSYFFLDNKKYVMAMIQDVTKAVADEIQINDQLEKLKEIAWMQSHTIRAPVARILGIMKILQGDIQLTEKEKYDWFKRLDKTTEELDSVIRNIVRLTYYADNEKSDRLESGLVFSFEK